MRDSDIAYEKLKSMIIKTQLKPGEVLNENKLIEKLGLGRTPIREALNRLSWDRLVEIIPRKGIMVSQVSLNDLQSIFELRCAYEELIGKLVPERITQGQIEQLENIINKDAYDCISEFDVNVRIDKDFHMALVKICKNRFLEEDYNKIYNASLRLLYLNKAKMQNLTQTVDECNKVLNNIKENSGHGLHKILKSHINDFKKKVLSSY